MMHKRLYQGCDQIYEVENICKVIRTYFQKVFKMDSEFKPMEKAVKKLKSINVARKELLNLMKTQNGNKAL